MEEEFQEIEVEEDALLGEDEIDIDYEFDAPQFFDFTRPETFWDGDEAEQWFELAESYPSSPFAAKFRLIDEVSAAEDNNGRGHECCDQTMQEVSNGQTKTLSRCLSKSKVSTFMKPTASHLAKQKNAMEVVTPRSFRFKNQSPSPTPSPSKDNQFTKRQKLEAGYLSKVSRLKHQAHFTHKKSKEVDPTGVNSAASRPKGTVPKEPNLSTAIRAQRHRSKTNAESAEDKSSSKTFKARPLNKKILEAPEKPSVKKKTSRATEFNEFRLKTSERAMQHTSSNANSISSSETKDLKRTNSRDGSRQEQCRMISKIRGSPDDKQLSNKGERGVFRSIKVFPLEPNDKRLIKELLTEPFSKLSLNSEAKQTMKSKSKEQQTPKGLKENRPGSLHQERKMNMAKEGVQRHCGKQHNQCVNDSLISKHTCMLELGH